jgi:hypothetical protein
MIPGSKGHRIIDCLLKCVGGNVVPSRIQVPVSLVNDRQLRFWHISKKVWFILTNVTTCCRLKMSTACSLLR